MNVPDDIRRLSPEQLRRWGLTEAERADFRNTRSKGFTIRETVEIIKRSRVRSKHVWPPK